MEITARVAAAYDIVAAEFAQKNAMMPADLLDVGPRFLAQAGPGATILDVGCGAGRDLAWLTQRGVSAVGGDRSTGMLMQARRHAPVPLAQLDMRALPFVDGAFGGVWCSAALLHLPKADAPGALAEMHRVLRSHGPLLLSIQEGDGEAWETWPYGTVERFFARYGPDEIAGLLAKAGFRIQESHAEQTLNRRWLRLLAARTA